MYIIIISALYVHCMYYNAFSYNFNIQINACKLIYKCMQVKVVAKCIIIHTVYIQCRYNNYVRNFSCSYTIIIIV